MKILVFDTETTGLPEKNASIYDTDKWPHIVQLSYVLYDMETNHSIIQDNYIKIDESVVISERSYEKVERKFKCLLTGTLAVHRSAQGC